MTWWKIEITCKDPDELAPSIISLGASGTQELSPTTFLCYYEGEASARDEFLRAAQEIGATVISVEIVDEVNWVQHCHEIWEPVSVGDIHLQPVLEANLNTSSEQHTGITIKLIPGSGFGTGHHDSTRQLLLFLQELQHEGFWAERLLDLGTGSGILAIASARLFRANVLGIDIDAQAIENAKQNLILNSLGDRITLRCGELWDSEGPFSLVCANIYAEVLCSLEQRISRNIVAGGYLLLAGVLREKRDLLLEVYSADWEVIRERVSGEWWAGVLKKN